MRAICSRSCIAGPEATILRALILILQRMLRAGFDRGIFRRGLRSSRHRRLGSARIVFHESDADGSHSRVWQSNRGLASAYFFPRPSCGGACKRLNLFLRWMVRRDAVDFGLWKTIPASKLVVPLDTHVIRVGRCLRLTRYREPGMEDGGGHHGIASQAGSGRSGEVRFLVVPSRHGRSMRVQPRAGGFGLPAARPLPSPARVNGRTPASAGRQMHVRYTPSVFSTIRRR